MESAPARCEHVPAFPLLPEPPICTPPASVTGATSRCEPVLAFSLIPDLSTCPAWPSTASISARCEPFSAFPLLPEPPTCTPTASVTGATSRCEPVSAFPLIPDLSTCPAWLSAASAAMQDAKERLKSRMTDSRLMLLPHQLVNASPPGTPPRPPVGAPYGKRLSAVRIEFANGFGTAKAGSAVPISPHSPGPSSHFRNPGPGSHFRSAGPGTMEQGISFVKIRGFKVADYNPRLRAHPWNIRRRVEHRGAHQGRFHSPRRFSEARVRKKGPGAHGTALGRTGLVRTASQLFSGKLGANRSTNAKSHTPTTSPAPEATYRPHHRRRKTARQSSQQPRQHYTPTSINPQQPQHQQQKPHTNRITNAKTARQPRHQSWQNRISSNKSRAPTESPPSATPRANHLTSAACINASCTATGRRRTFP